MDSGDFNRQAVTVFGYDATAPELLLIREAFKRAKTLLVYRVDGGGSKATKEIGGITVTARYSGTGAMPSRWRYWKIQTRASMW